MSDRFTGKAVPKGVSLPADLWAYLEARRRRIGIPVSVQVQRALEDAIFADVESRHPPESSVPVPAFAAPEVVARQLWEGIEILNEHIDLDDWMRLVGQAFSEPTPAPVEA